jgi:hypothetical protein
VFGGGKIRTIRVGGTKMPTARFCNTSKASGL